MKTRNIIILAICFLLIASFAVSQTRYPHGFTGGGTNTFEDVVVTGTYVLTGLFTANGGILVPDDTDISLGDASDVTLAYDEAGTDRLILTTVAAGGLNLLNGNIFIGPGVPVAALDGLDLYVGDTSEFTGHVYTKANVYLVDDALLAFGATNDAYFWYDETTDDLLKLTIASATGGLMLETGNLFLGASTPGQTIDGNDAFISGLVEIDGVLYADGGALIPDDINLCFGDGPDSCIYYDEAGDDEIVINGADWAFNGSLSTGGDIYIEDDNALTLGDNDDITLKYDENGTDQGRFGGTAGLIFENACEFDSALDINADVDIDGNFDVEATTAGGASIGPMIKFTAQSGQTYTGGTTAGLRVKLYDEDNSVVHSGGEHAGVYANVKLLSAMTDGGKSMIYSGHNYGTGGDFQALDYGMVLYGDIISGFHLTGGSSTNGIDFSDQTITGFDFLMSNGESIDNFTDGTVSVTGGFTASGIITPTTGIANPDDQTTCYGDGDDSCVQFDSAEGEVTIDGVGWAFVGFLSTEADIYIEDDMGLVLGDNDDITLKYDENGTDQGRFGGTAGLIFENACEFDKVVTVAKGVQPGVVTADPCGDTIGYPTGSMFYNGTSNYFCYCNGSNDVKMSDDSTACFAE